MGPRRPGSKTASMANPRTHLNLTILPDNTVLATGRSTDIGGVNTAHAVYQAELWSPVTQTWTAMASGRISRTSTTPPHCCCPMAGSRSPAAVSNYFNNFRFAQRRNLLAAYLFKGARPIVTSAPATLAYNSSFFVGTPDAASITSVALIHDGSVTHAFNMDQNYVPLTFTQSSDGLMVTAPANANLAPPATTCSSSSNSTAYRPLRRSCVFPPRTKTRNPRSPERADGDGRRSAPPT